jgi:hypothetical protein
MGRKFQGSLDFVNSGRFVMIKLSSQELIQ